MEAGTQRAHGAATIIPSQPFAMQHFGWCCETYTNPLINGQIQVEHPRELSFRPLDNRSRCCCCCCCFFRFFLRRCRGIAVHENALSNCLSVSNPALHSRCFVEIRTQRATQEEREERPAFNKLAEPRQRRSSRRRRARGGRGGRRRRRRRRKGCRLSKTPRMASAANQSRSS